MLTDSPSAGIGADLASHMAAPEDSTTTTKGRPMPLPGRIVFSEMEEVVFGQPAAGALDELARRFDARRIFLEDLAAR